MKSLKGTKTHTNLKDAFAGESQANRRYLYFAKVADIEGNPEIAGLFRDTAEGETGHAHGHLDYLKSVGDPVEAIQHELDTYNELLAKPGELSATLLIEYAEPQTREAALVRLVGLENHFWSVTDERRTRAEFDQRQFDGERVSSVQFVRFPLPDVNQERFIALAQKGELAIEADHPFFAARAVIAGDTAASLAEDLR